MNDLGIRRSPRFIDKTKRNIPAFDSPTRREPNIDERYCNSIDTMDNKGNHTTPLRHRLSKRKDEEYFHVSSTGVTIRQQSQFHDLMVTPVFHAPFRENNSSPTLASKKRKGTKAEKLYNGICKEGKGFTESNILSPTISRNEDDAMKETPMASISSSETHPLSATTNLCHDLSSEVIVTETSESYPVKVSSGLAVGCIEVVDLMGYRHGVNIMSSKWCICDVIESLYKNQDSDFYRDIIVEDEMGNGFNVMGRAMELDHSSTYYIKSAKGYNSSLMSRREIEGTFEKNALEINN